MTAQFRRSLPRQLVSVEPTGSASWLEGELVDVVYLGMITQYHVDTVCGRFLSHRLTHEARDELAPGSSVLLRWDPEQTSVLGLGAEAALDDAPADLRGEHDEERERHHDDGDGDHLR